MQVGLGLGVLLGVGFGMLLQKVVRALCDRLMGVRIMRHHRFDRPSVTEMPMEELTAEA